LGPLPVNAVQSLPVFGLRKTWVDPGPGIAMVQIHYTWTPPGAEPDWANAEETVLAPGSGTAGLRTAVLELPRLVDGAPDYSLHHFFFVVGANDDAASPRFTEDIVAREITYTDDVGRYTSVGVVWSAVDPSPESAVPNYTSTAMDGLSFQSPGVAPEDASIYEFVRAQPLPHVFHGMVWGIRGSEIRYGFHLIRHGSPDPAEDIESWADNGGSGWTLQV
jgi:hypothetical protein